MLQDFQGETKVNLSAALLASGNIDLGPGGVFVVIGGTESAIPTDPLERSDFSGDGKFGFEDFITFAGAFGVFRAATGFAIENEVKCQRAAPSDRCGFAKWGWGDSSGLIYDRR